MKTTSVIAIMLLLTMCERVGATGALYVRPLNSSMTHQQMSIRTFDATTTIDNQVATTTVDQVFHNSLNALVESTFIFPLPEGAVITDMAYWFNGQKYTASIRVKEEAQKLYDQKIRKYIDPALLQYFGDNVFKMNIAPINPKSDVRFTITYIEQLPYEYGKINYKFLLRTTGLSPSPLERVSLKIRTKTSAMIRELVSPSHGNTPENKITKISDREYSIQYGDENFSPDRDYTLRFEYQRDGVEMNVVTYYPKATDSIGSDGFFATCIIPPDSLTATIGESRTIVFTADVSSSMEGERIIKLKETLNEFLKRLHSNDKFNVVLFSTNVVMFQPKLVRASSENIEQAKKFVYSIGAAGLTNIDEALTSTLNLDFDSTENNSTIFITDGMPSWGELDIAKIIVSSKKLNTNKTRIYVYGIGNEPSKEFLNELAIAHGGYAMFINNTDSMSIIVQNHLERISRPILTDLNIEYGGLLINDTYPQQLPDLFYGNQITHLGRFKDPGDYTVTLKGKIRNEEFQLSKKVSFHTEQGNKSVSRIWAKTKIDFLLSQIQKFGEKKELVDAIIDLSTRFNILTKYTALYADPDDNTTNIAENHNIRHNSLFTVHTIAPNPGDGNLSLSIAIHTDNATLLVEIIDVLGNRVALIAQDHYTLGEHTLQWDGFDMNGNKIPAGMYFVRINVNNQQFSTVPYIIH